MISSLSIESEHKRLGTQLLPITSVVLSACLSRKCIVAKGGLDSNAVWAVSAVDQGMGVLYGVEIVKGEWAVLWENLWRPIVTNEDFVA